MSRKTLNVKKNIRLAVHTFISCKSHSLSMPGSA